MQLTYEDVAKILLKNEKESDYVAKIMYLIGYFESKQVSPLQALVEIMDGATSEVYKQIHHKKLLREFEV